MRFSEVVLLEVADVYAAHADALPFGGGSDGVRDAGVIASAVALPRQGYCQTLGEIAAAYVHGIAKNHGFIDGNKRTASVALAYFLGLNDFEIELTDEWVSTMEGVADGSVSRAELAGLIASQFPGGVDIPIEDDP